MISADSSMKQEKVQGSMATQMEGKAGVLESEMKMEEAAKEDQKVSKTEDKDKTKKKNADDKIDEDKKSEATSDPVGHNVDVKL